MTTAEQDARHGAGGLLVGGGKSIRRIRIGWWIAVGVVIYCLIAIAAYWPVAPLARQQIVTCGCYDIAEQTWFLVWTPFAILHHLNLFSTNYIDFPRRVNLAGNTLMPALGLLASPITLTLGPVAAFNLLMRLAFAASATSMFLVLRRWTVWLPAAFVGGLLYGFSPYMMAQGSLHLNLLFVPFPPIIFALFDDLVVRQKKSAKRSGLLLGLVSAIQFLISSEVLAAVAVLVFLGLLLLAVRYWREIRSRIRYLATGIAWAIGLCMLLIGYPIWFFLAGPDHLTGPIQPIYILQGFRADLLGSIVPTRSQRFGPAHLIAIGSNYETGNLPENGSYLGIPLILVTVGFVLFIRRHAAIIRACAVMALIALVLSLGPSLMFNNRDTHLWLPFRIFTSMPLLRNEVPVRYSLYVQLFVAVIFAVGIDRIALWRIEGRRCDEGKKWVVIDGIRWRNVAAAVLVSAFALVPVAPNFPYLSPSAGVPPFFTSRELKTITPGTVVLTYPFPFYPDNQAMLWQAVTAMRFRIIGGYAVTPDASGNGTLNPPSLNPPALEQLLESAMYGPTPTVPTPPRTKATFDAIRKYLTSYDVRTIVAVTAGKNPNLAFGYLQRVLGPPADVQGVLIWHHVQVNLARREAAADHSHAS